MSCSQVHLVADLPQPWFPSGQLVSCIVGQTSGITVHVGPFCSHTMRPPMLNLEAQFFEKLSTFYRYPSCCGEQLHNGDPPEPLVLS